MIQCVKLAQSVVAANTACFMTFHAMSNMYKCSTTIIAACKQLVHMKMHSQSTTDSNIYC